MDPSLEICAKEGMLVYEKNNIRLEAVGERVDLKLGSGRMNIRNRLYLAWYYGRNQTPKRSKAKYILFDPLNMETCTRVLVLASYML